MLEVLIVKFSGIIRILPRKFIERRFLWPHDLTAHNCIRYSLAIDYLSVRLTSSVQYQLIGAWRASMFLALLPQSYFLLRKCTLVRHKSLFAWHTLRLLCQYINAEQLTAHASVLSATITTDRRHMKTVVPSTCRAVLHLKYSFSATGSHGGRVFEPKYGRVLVKNSFEGQAVVAHASWRRKVEWLQ